MHSMSVIEVAEGLNERYGDTDTDLYVDATYLAHGLLRYGSVLKTKLCWELEPSKAADSFAQAVGSFALQRRGNRLKFPASNSYAPGSWAPPVVRAQVQKVARQLVDCKFGGRHALAAPSLAQLYSPKFINPLLQLAAREQQQLQQTRFKLALACGNIQVAMNVAADLGDDAWRQLGVEALRQGNHEVVEMSYQKTKEFDAQAGG
ncbi:hypothetical protein B484DRAFT_14049 [Ochromonadaceae sp. CCMP2298]|nr:hypothetical protein B484DRAFT_14049 [Ochromonadaceae sp. CCMP2298]